MMISLRTIERIRQAFIPLRKTLIKINAAMDNAYSVAAEQLGFVCSGCNDSCCRSQFYHYTYLEYFYLLEGINQLDPALRLSLRQSAANVRQEDSVKKRGFRNRSMCPLNLEGRCSLYLYRPMICRLHGIPHKLERPGQGLLCGPGCETFERGRRNQNGVRLDRTPHYRQLAALERKLKQAAEVDLKIKMTIAEMILSFETL